MVPAMYNLCLLEPDFERHDLSRWRIGGYGGAPMPLATIARSPKSCRAEADELYGATETTSPATLMPPGCTAAHADSVGRARLRRGIAWSTTRHEVYRGDDGESGSSGPMVVPGYWDDPEATAREFTDGFWHSGDLGSLDADGYVRVFDRKKDMINRGGYKIYTVEVENALTATRRCSRRAVVAAPCPVLGERVHAFVCLRASGRWATARPAAHCADAWPTTRCRRPSLSATAAAAQRQRQAAEARAARANEIGRGRRMSEAEQPLIVRRDGPIAQLRFNRPAVLNALDSTTAQAFLDACRSFAADNSVRVVVVSGAGRAFMAGGRSRRTARRSDRYCASADRPDARSFTAAHSNARAGGREPARCRSRRGTRALPSHATSLLQPRAHALRSPM